MKLHRTDLIIAVPALCAAAYLALAGHWVPGWWRSALVFGALAVGAPVLRFVARLRPELRWADVAASFWLLPAAAFGHQALGPIVDALHPRLVDAALAETDLRLFGFLPAALLSQATGPLLTELLLVCYYGHFIWPLVLGVLLYRTRGREAYEHYTAALALTFAATYAAYVFMPAVGPRFFLAHAFERPLEGLWLTPWLDSAMRGPMFMRDCFPSGHTATTLVVLTFAHRYHRPFFWVVLAPGLGLIAATLVGRFHYGIDLVVALPFAALTIAASTFLMRAPFAAVRFGLGARAAPGWTRPSGQPA